jgi:hypothetical protein
MTSLDLWNKVGIREQEWGVVMDSRRSVLKKLLVGTATAAAVPGSASAALGAAAQSVPGRAGLSLPAGPAPWWLLAPFGMGSPLKFGWYVADLSSVERGAAVLTLAHSSGRRAQVHLCAHNGRPQGMTHSKLIDFVLMDGGSGSFRTDEKLGRVVLGLAEAVRRNELDPQGDLWPLAKMMTHDDRVTSYGAETLV